MDIVFRNALAATPGELRAATEAQWQAFAPSVASMPQTPAAREWLAALVKAFACSGFVAQTALRHPPLISELLESEALYSRYPAHALAERVRRSVASVCDENGLKRLLRSLRRREMLRIAWRDLSGRAELAEVVATLSELADACIDAALGWHAQRAYAEHGVPRGAGGEELRLVVLALGKLGGHELNFSSDVDLIFTYPQEGELPGSRALSYGELFVRLCQSLIRTLGESTADGFVFRVDTRLRPFGASGPLALSFNAMEHYYQAHGREWERYAFIKARVCAGDRAGGESLLGRLRPFVYRRYIDFGALAAIREMKELIAREVERKSMVGNVKLGPGGIREIEFIVQALQLIRGGREPALQERATLKALAQLTRAGHLPESTWKALSASYEFLRRVEHRLQMAADQQTHELPTDPLDRLRLAFAMGFTDWPSFERALEDHRAHVQEQFRDLLGSPETPAAATDALAILWPGTVDPERGANILREAGYADPRAVLALLEELRASSAYHALSAEGRVRVDRLVPLLLRQTARVAHPDVTIARLVHLCEAIGRRTAYFALLIENPTALAQLVNLAAASPWIAGWISRHPVLLDELLDPRGLYELPDREALERELNERFEQLGDNLEAQTDWLREFRNAHLLRVAAADIGPGLPADRVGAHLSQLADVLLENCLRIAYRMLIERHGPPGGDARRPQPGFAIIGYGKLGGLELGYASDLDMIFLYDEVEGGVTRGERPIPNELFFARLGQRLIHLLTARTSAGILYEVDMRLRPSGNAGPLVTSLNAFRRYQENRAWTWEHQALVRARPVAGKAELCAAFAQARRAVLCRPRDESKLRQEVKDMRARMAATHATAKTESGFDVKHDRGGIVDIEFMVQYWVLRWAHAHPDVTVPTDNVHILAALAGVGAISAARADFLSAAYHRLLSVEQRLKLMERGTRVAAEELGDSPQAVLKIWNEVFETE
jgi:[glutamine synthetase] adenylyltransferase / [glutamine synthetase]-adenylyl-L-tyrosine phosphorylase